MAKSKIIRGVEEINQYLEGDSAAARVVVPRFVDVAAIRKKLNMTQAQFAESFGLNKRTVQNWEQGREPEDAARAYLKVIERDPEAVRRALLTAA